MIAENLPESRRHLLHDRLFAHLAWMAFDGFAINHRIGDLRNIEAIADITTDLLLGPEHAGVDVVLAEEPIDPLPHTSRDTVRRRARG